MLNIEELGLYDYKELNVQEIEKIERNLGIDLPLDYKTFISHYNKAFLGNKNIFIFKEDKGYRFYDKDKLDCNGFQLNYFLNFEIIDSLIEPYYKNANLDPKELIPIISDQGNSYFFICCKKGKNYGKIFYEYIMPLEYNINGLYYVADDIEEFLKCIVDEETYEKTYEKTTYSN